MRPYRLVALASAFLLAAASASAVSLGRELMSGGFSLPIFATAPPGDTERLFVVEQGGTIDILVLDTKTVLGTPFLDISANVNSGGEEGLLGLAFDPDYASNGFFYVYYSASNPRRTILARYSVDGNPATSNLADDTSEVQLFTIGQPASNHNGGMLAFGPNDGYLYIATGDGGGAGDPDENAQNLTTMLGKILRIDVVEGGEGAGTGTANYDIPPSNPGLGTVPEIWAYGLRNPWRFSFDRNNGNMYIGDVGQGAWEEIDFQPFSSSGGENYGWDIKEGDACFEPPTGCETVPGLTDPIHTYPRGGGSAVTGGYVYRGAEIPFLVGHYLFADYIQGVMSSFRYIGTITEPEDWTTELNSGTFNVSTFAEDQNGELYYTNYGGGQIWKIIPTENDTVYADFTYGGIERGTQTQPFDTFQEAIDSVADGGTVILDPGTSAETLTINQNVRIESTGLARIGDTTKTEEGPKTGFVSKP